MTAPSDHRGEIESDAREKWCPFTRGAWARPDDERGWRMTGGEIGFNRAFIRPGREEASVGRCIGARCMAWRTTGTQKVRTDVKMIGLTKTETVTLVDLVGHCGLAGPPGFSNAALPHPGICDGAL